METNKLLYEVKLGIEKLTGVMDDVKDVLQQPLVNDLYTGLVTLHLVEDYLVEIIEIAKEKK